MKIKAGQTLLFIGDSITDCGRGRPVGERGSLGEGYVSLVFGLLGAVYPDQGIKVLNTGIGGNRVTDLEARWTDDVLKLKPDWLSVMIGINDVWRQFDNDLDQQQVDIRKFESTLRKLLRLTRPKLKGLVLMTPFFLEANPEDPMRKLMDQYGQVVRKLAKEFNAGFVDVQAAFDRYLQHRPTQSLCGDRVHPNRVGHTIIAKAFLDAIGFEWPAG